MVPIAQAAPQAGAVAEQPDQVEDRDHDANSIANRLLISAIISFLDDRFAAPLLNRIQQDNSANRC